MVKYLKTSVILIEILAISGLIIINMNMPTQKPSSIQANLVPPIDASLSQNPKPIEPAISTNQEPKQVPLRAEKIDEQTYAPHKDTYKIAFYGDSMIDTLGENLPAVAAALKNKYRNIKFELYNYGIGSENVVEGLSRFRLPYNYKNRNYPPITELKPDIVVLGSYSYNPLTPFDKNESWLLLADLINKAKQTGASVYVLSEQAPIKAGFATGAGGVNWPPEISDPHVDKIVDGLKNAVAITTPTETSLINVFDESKISGSEYGDPVNVSKHDGIHYSDEGLKLTARVIAESLVLK